MNIKEVKVRPNTSRKWSEGFTRIYIFLEGETVWQNLENRHERPYTIYKKELLPQILEQLKAQGIDLTGQKISWSQRAGCNCGCSPGFVVSNHRGKEIYVTITA